MKIQKLIVILIVCLLSFPFATAFPAFADEISSGEQPSNPHDPPVISEEPKPSEGQLLDENDSPLKEKDDSNIWLYVGVGAGVTVLAVSSIFVIKAIKRKKGQW